jgi:hypothetical protein
LLVAAAPPGTAAAAPDSEQSVVAAAVSSSQGLATVDPGSVGTVGSPPGTASTVPEASTPSFWVSLPSATLPAGSPTAHAELGDRFVWGRVPSGRRERPWKMIVGAVIAVVALVTAAVAVVVVRDGGTSFPTEWDPQVASIAASVESLRGLTFKHPVRINYLSAQAFEQRLTPSADDLKKEHAQIETATGLFRALGFIGANVNLADAATTTQTADTLAFYDIDTKQVYVRGTGPFTIETTVTLAHELTHVLQDQYFDLPKLEKAASDSKTGSSDALRALIEGDAVRIQHRYLADQSAADRRTYARLSTDSADTADERTQHVPAVIETSFSAPYIFGPVVLRVLDTNGGNQAVNDALTGPTPSTRIYLDPTAINRPALPPPPVPSLADGEKKISESSSDNEDSFDDFMLYLMIASRLDASTALRTADAFASGSSVFFTHNNTTCFRASLKGLNRDATGYLATIIRRWTHTMSDAAIDANSARTVVFHSCDPGGRARTPPDSKITGATRLASGRDEIIATFVADKLPLDLAICAARLLVDTPELANAIITDRPLSHSIAGEARSAGIACRNDHDAGLP